VRTDGRRAAGCAVGASARKRARAIRPASPTRP